jgi:hypothetical protein
MYCEYFEMQEAFNVPGATWISNDQMVFNEDGNFIDVTVPAHVAGDVMIEIYYHGGHIYEPSGAATKGFCGDDENKYYCWENGLRYVASGDENGGTNIVDPDDGGEVFPEVPQTGFFSIISNGAADSVVLSATAGAGIALVWYYRRKLTSDH